METRSDSQIQPPSSSQKITGDDQNCPGGLGATNGAAAAVRDAPLTTVELRMVLERFISASMSVDRLVTLCREWEAGTKSTPIAERLGVTKGVIMGRVRLLIAAKILCGRGDPTIPTTGSRRERAREYAREYRERVKGDSLRKYTTRTESRPDSRVPDSAPRRLVPLALSRPLAPAPKPPPVPRPAVVRPPTVTYAAPWLGRVTECCWPIGDPGTRGFRFCDAPSEPGRPYCGDHSRTAFVRIASRSKPRDDGYARPVAP